MYGHKTIRSITAGIMLLLFAFSITPRQLLHDSITGHKHGYVKHDAAVNLQAPKSNFQCSWNNDAIESPFTTQPGLLLGHPVTTYSSEFNIYIFNYYSTFHFFSSLRGPPSQA